MNIHAQTTSNKTWSPVERAFQFTFTFAFASKGQYLDFRRHWKEFYAALATSSREQKQLVRVTMRNGGKAGAHQARMLSLKAEARLQLLMLTAAKQEANRQYLAAKQMTT